MVTQPYRLWIITGSFKHTVNFAKNVPGVQTRFGEESRKTIWKFQEKRKNFGKFVYILAKQCGSQFNLTNIFDKKISKF